MLAVGSSAVIIDLRVRVFLGSDIQSAPEYPPGRFFGTGRVSLSCLKMLLQHHTLGEPNGLGCEVWTLPSSVLSPPLPAPNGSPNRSALLQWQRDPVAQL